MKKSLLALAVLTAVTGAASAQSSVTLYGKVDLGLVLDAGGPNGKSVRLGLRRDRRFAHRLQGC